MSFIVTELLSLKMEIQLKQLMMAHDVTESGERLDLLPPSRRPIIVQGYCSTPKIDHHRTSIRNYAFGSVVSHVPLLIHHDPNRVAGEIKRLTYKPEGLWVEALVSDPEGRRMPAFSIAGQVLEYSMHDIEGPDFWAKIMRGKLREISLTDFPANEDCRITRRFEAPASDQYFDALIRKTSCLQQLSQHILQMNKCEEARRFR